MSSFLGVPIQCGDTVVGSLYLTDKQGGGAFTEADEVAAQALSVHAAVAIHHFQTLAHQRALVRALMTAQEEERRTVAYDIHDGLTQYVMAAHAHLEAFRRAHQNGQAAPAATELEQSLQYLKEAVVESRRLVNGLALLALDDLGLAGSLEQLVKDEKERSGWSNAEFIHNIALRRFDKMLETAVYRVAQEALTNAHKHADADQVRVVLLEEDASTGAPLLRLEVRDWGKGFQPEHQTLQLGHFGLPGMVERVHLLGGTHKLHSVPGEGTTVCAIFPALPPQAEASASDRNAQRSQPTATKGAL